MSRTKDLQIDLMNLENDWLDFLNDVFVAEGWEVLSSHGREAGDLRPDAVLMQRGDVVLVELKLIRSGRVPRALLRNASAGLERMIVARGAAGGILIIPQRMTNEAWAEVQSTERQRIELWDLTTLIEKTTLRPRLASRLSDLLRALQIGAENAPDDHSTIAMLADESRELPPAGEGTRLAEALEATKPGKSHGAAQQFEKLCEEALVLLFGSDLIGWRRQSAIEHGFQRVDLIARLQPVQSAFWATLVNDFRARYVVFEFKNYTNPITQDQIYGTERYLYASALRSVAIVVARNGYDNNAHRAVQGALREQGKLILCLDLKEFTGMLRSFDAGDEYEDVLLAKRDDLLMSLAR